MRLALVRHMTLTRRTCIAIAAALTLAVAGAAALAAWPRPVSGVPAPSSAAQAQRDSIRSAVEALQAPATTGAARVSDPDRLSAGLLEARSQLAAYRRVYRHLDGVVVREAATPGGTEAVSFYTIDRIVLSPGRSHSVSTIMAHEIWHVIDWRDNGRIDWGEAIPPPNAADYRR